MVRRAKHAARKGRPAPAAACAASWLALAVVAFASPARAEDGYELWLRYRPVDEPLAARYRAAVTEIVAPAEDRVAARELDRALAGLLGVRPRLAHHVDRDGAVVLRTSTLASASTPALDGLGPDGYVLRSTHIAGHRATMILARTSTGALYGAFHFLRLLQTHQSIDQLSIRSVPRIRRRILNHWDNLDGSVERGYAGASIWDWHKLPDYLSPRYTDYARACASVGINGSVVTNVNADSAALTRPYLRKAAALAGVLRAYGVRLYLTARLTAPTEIGGLATADPLDPRVRDWWRRKADEIYEAIPDFGGLLVKAGVEGQPGPAEFGRSPVDAANLIAGALAPHGGVLLWRAFVWANDPTLDRARRAYDEFAPLDGRFAANVILQVKNGPIDFQPREPAHPLFGAMPRTSLALELQLTKEYLGFATHLVYLGPLMHEVLSWDTYARGRGSTVARVIDGSLFASTDSAIAGVSNVGADRNWTGSNFDQANWYAFGRMAWDPDASTDTVAEEWTRMTFSNAGDVVRLIVAMMGGSREAAVDYMTPLGLAHLMAAGHHYGPGAWQTGASLAVWDPPYYHRADAHGIGFDRTATGSNALAQYAPAVADRLGDLQRVPDEYLLWFHHVAWDRRLDTGRTVWEELVSRYDRGVAYVHEMRRTWASLEGRIDAERFAEVSAFLRIQEDEARWWRDATLLYFQRVSGLPFPPGFDPPTRRLEEFESETTLYAPGDPSRFPARH